MIRVVTEWTGYEGGPYYTTLYFGGSTAGEAVAAANAVRLLWEDLEGFLAAPGHAQIQSDVPRVDPATGQILEVFTVTMAPSDMTVVSDTLPPANQALVRLRTGFYVGGRELRGRVFIPGQIEAGSTLGRPTAAWRTALEDAFELMASNAAAGGSLVVWSPTHGVADVVGTISVWDQFAVLRSRRD